MPDKPFGADLWQNLQAVKFGKDRSIQAPVRANGRDGVVVGRDAITSSERAEPSKTPSAPAARRGWRRLFRR